MEETGVKGRVAVAGAYVKALALTHNVTKAVPGSVSDVLSWFCTIVRTLQLLPCGQGVPVPVAPT